MDVRADGADVRRRRWRRAPSSATVEARRARRPIGVVDAMPAARRAQMLAQELAGLRREQPHVQVVPLHLHALPDPAGRRAVVRGLDFDAAIEMHRALAEAVVPKRFERQRPERRAFLGKHLGDLAFGRAVDPRVGPVRLPAIEIRLRGLERLEAQAFERRLLRVADAGFDFAFAIGIAHATRQRDDAVVREHVAIERIERRVVDVRREHAFSQIVEHDDLHRAAQSTKGALVQLRPDLRARSPRQQPHGFARVAQRQHEEARAAVLAGAGSRTIGPSP